MFPNLLKQTVFATASTAVILASVTTNSAQAVQLHYDFTGPRDTQDSFDFTVDGITVTATGLYRSGPGGQLDSARVRQTEDGLGVKSRRVADNNDKQGQIDGLGRNESLLLDFTPNNVRLLSATFGRVNGNDDFRLFVDGNKLIHRADIPSNNMFDFEALSNTTGSQFRFTVTENNDDYTLKSAVFQAVPEPASILGLFTVAGLATSGLKLKRKSVA